MALLTATRTILTHVPGDDSRLYVASDEESGVIRRSVYVDIETYQDLGEPEEITVTIEPGDTLNN